ncbi:MAG TPA: T9SS type A sorting domain-containing protein, partial [Cytophagaceae bacterium]
ASVVSNCPLPVEWLSFDGELINGKVFLRWSTASEINNSFFEIQRSADGHYFETIAKKEGGNNTNSISLYKFTDYSPLQGVSYYRLIQHDFDGNVYYTPSISIYTHNKPFVISPNPFTDVVSVRAFEGATIIVTDMLGKVLLHDVLKSDEYHFGNELVSGTYIVSLIHENSTEHKVVIKK